MTQLANFSHAANVYRTAAAAVSPLAGVVMLYDGVIAELSRTIVSLQEKKRDEAFNHLDRATTILRGLCHNLDFERGGSFAERMRDTYVRLILSALNCFSKPDAVAQLAKLIDGITDLRNAWADVRIQQMKAGASKA